MSKYNLMVRRHKGEDWSAWCNTNDEDILKQNINAVEKNGWLWSLEPPMTPTTFKTTCYAMGIDNKLIQTYCIGKTKFVSDDIEELRRRATNG